MPELFDAYHKWLGIPPKDQPPNHYRLLGVDLFEDDRDVIDAAANQRMSYLQELATGPQVEASQKLLNEISSARRCLLNAEAKAAYDEELRAQQPAVSTAESSAPATMPMEMSFDSVPPAATSHKRKDNAILVQAGIAVAALVIIVGILFLRGGGSADKSAGADEFKATIDTGVVFDWPLRERTGAMVIIDGEKKELPEERFLQYELEPGEYRAIVIRDGYPEMAIDIRLKKGKVETYRLDWKRSMAN